MMTGSDDRSIYLLLILWEIDYYISARFDASKRKSSWSKILGYYEVIAKLVVRAVVWKVGACRLAEMWLSIEIILQK